MYWSLLKYWEVLKPSSLETKKKKWRLRHASLNAAVSSKSRWRCVTRSSKTGIAVFCQRLLDLTAVGLEDSIGLLGLLQLWWGFCLFYCSLLALTFIISCVSDILSELSSMTIPFSCRVVFTALSRNSEKQRGSTEESPIRNCKIKCTFSSHIIIWKELGQSSFNRKKRKTVKAISTVDIFAIQADKAYKTMRCRIAFHCLMVIFTIKLQCN